MDLARARHAVVVERVDAVEAGAVTPHLREPRPDLLGRSGDGDAARDLRRGVLEELVARQRTGLFARAGRSEALRERRQERASNEVRTGPDYREIAAKFGPGIGVGRIDADLDRDPRF